MCGVCGVYNFETGEPADRLLLKQMCDVISYRGPDDEGYYTDGNLGLGCRRLAIIDLATGHQPLANEDGNIVCVFNGEVYNYIELTDDLKKKGHIFRSRGDAEVLVHLYEEEGRDFVGLLNGMFAFAIWDKRKREILIYRDRMGVKPLYYAETKQGLLFASEIKSIFAGNSVVKEINYQAICDYLTYNYVPPPQTIFRGIMQVPPGCMLICGGEGIELKKYWKIPVGEKNSISIDEASGLLLELLKDAVKIRLHSDVPLGAFLSGGIDSSTVVGLMAEISEGPVSTFSIGFKEKDFNELGYAGLTARHFHTEHHENIMDIETIGLLPKVVYHCDQPHGDVSFLPFYLLSKEARRKVTVALTGDGGDELFGGYTHYLKGGEIKSENPSDLTGAERRYYNFLSLFSDEEKDRLFSSDFRARVDFDASFSIMKGCFEESKGMNFYNQLLYIDQRLLLPGNNLVKPDRMGMANSLELRAPFMDFRVVEFASSLPADFKFRNGVTKLVHRQAVLGLLPQAIISREKRMLTVPIGEWFKGELRDYCRDLLFSRKAEERGYFNSGYVKEMFDMHQSCRKNYTRQLRALLILELWHRIFIDGEYDAV